MAEIRTVTTLQTKRQQICHAIVRYEQLLAQARADLAHVTATISLFEMAERDGSTIQSYADVHRLFKHRELMDICKAALETCGPLDTRQLAVYALNAKGMDHADKLLAKAVANRIIHAMRMQYRRGKVFDIGRRGGVRIWTIKPPGAASILSIACSQDAEPQPVQG